MGIVSARVGEWKGFPTSEWAAPGEPGHAIGPARVMLEDLGVLDAPAHDGGREGRPKGPDEEREGLQPWLPRLTGML